MTPKSSRRYTVALACQYKLNKQLTLTLVARKSNRITHTLASYLHNGNTAKMHDMKAAEQTIKRLGRSLLLLNLTCSAS